MYECLRFVVIKQLCVLVCVRAYVLCVSVCVYVYMHTCVSVCTCMQNTVKSHC